MVNARHMCKFLPKDGSQDRREGSFSECGRHLRNLSFAFVLPWQTINNTLHMPDEEVSLSVPRLPRQIKE